ncbi:MAG TPA: PA2779 family protein [Thiohalobacter sp.]|nr:PA2779 family protein [Thiohalobacter sp.]
MRPQHWKRAGILALILNLLFATFPAAAHTGLVGTEEMLAAEARALHLADIQATLKRDEVRTQMLDLGVSPDQVEARLGALTDAELQQLATELNQLPAGAGVIEVVGIVFVVLLILELLDVTDIFTGI